jgi:BlaI family transcriptional regulator, penicillinase repressor
MTNPHIELGRRERQIMDIIYRRGRATAEEVRGDLPDVLSNPAVRGMLRLLEDKGFLKHEYDGPRFVYSATADPDEVRQGAVRELVRTFFSNSASSAVAAMLGEFRPALTAGELDRLEALIDEMRAKKGARGSAKRGSRKEDDR